jgi:hypothetical protein
VPKEVGKVGIESQKLIEPVAERSDGIKAMFKKQETTKIEEQTDASSLPNSPTKRKRIDEGQQSNELPAPKQVKIEKIDAWEDNTHLEYSEQSDKSVSA